MCRWVVQKQFLRYIICERALCRQPTWKRTSGWWRRTLRVVVGCRELLDGGRSVECGGLVAGGRAGADVDDTRRLRVSIWRRRTKIHIGDPRLRGLVAQRAGTSSLLARAQLSVLLTRTGGDDHFAFSCRTHIATGSARQNESLFRSNGTHVFLSVGLSFRWDLVPAGPRFAACCLLFVMKFI